LSDPAIVCSRAVVSGIPHWTKSDEVRPEQTIAVRLETVSTVVEKPFKVGFSVGLELTPKESIPMKTLVIFAGIFTAILLAERAPAQTGTGLPPLPQVPKTPALQDQPNATHFWFIAAGDNRPSDKKLPQPLTLGQIFKDAQKFKPAFFLWCGDTIYGHTADETTLQNYLVFEVDRDTVKVQVVQVSSTTGKKALR
jgi:hypothetical protein